MKSVRKRQKPRSKRHPNHPKGCASERSGSGPGQVRSTRFNAPPASEPRALKPTAKMPKPFVETICRSMCVTPWVSWASEQLNHSVGWRRVQKANGGGRVSQDFLGSLQWPLQTHCEFAWFQYNVDWSLASLWIMILWLILETSNEWCDKRPKRHSGCTLMHLDVPGCKAEKMKSAFHLACLARAKFYKMAQPWPDLDQEAQSYWQLLLQAPPCLLGRTWKNWDFSLVHGQAQDRRSHWRRSEEDQGCWLPCDFCRLCWQSQENAWTIANILSTFLLVSSHDNSQAWQILCNINQRRLYKGICVMYVYTCIQNHTNSNFCYLWGSSNDRFCAFWPRECPDQHALNTTSAPNQM